MSESSTLISSFTHLIESSEHLSSQEIEQHTLKMMQMLASNPALLLHWKRLQETLEILYNSLEEAPNDLLAGKVNSAIRQLMT